MPSKMIANSQSTFFSSSLARDPICSTSQSIASGTSSYLGRGWRNGKSSQACSPPEKEKPLSGLLRFAGFGYIPHIPCVAHIFGAMPSDRSDNMRCYAQPFCMVWWSPDISTMVDYSRKFPGEGAWKQAKVAPYDSLFTFGLIWQRNTPF